MHDNAASSGSIDHPAEDMCRIKRRELELVARTVENLNNGDRDYLIEQGVFPAVPWFMWGAGYVSNEVFISSSHP